MKSKAEKGWEKIVCANVSMWNKQRDFFVNGWGFVVRRFEWLPKMFS